MKQEFDKYIENYRPNLDSALALSGETSDYFARYKAQKLAEWLKKYQIKNPRILDFGCGDGVMTNYVTHYFPDATVFGVDPSGKSIEVAQKSFSHIRFSVSSDESTDLTFENNFFDIIYAAGAFHHIPFNLHDGYMESLKRILKPNGFLVMFELNPLNPLTVRTFKRNPIDINAKMLSPWYAYRLAKKSGTPSLKFYCFFPRFMKFFRWSECMLTKVPFGALYAIIIKKNK